MRYLALLATLLLSSTAALAGGDDACWERNQSLIEQYVNPPEGGDNLFFTAVSQKGNVSLVFPTTKTMMYFPLSLYEVRNDGAVHTSGCTYGTFDNLKYFFPTDLPTQLSMNASADPSKWQGTYSKSTNYPDPEPYYVPKISGKGASASGIDGSKFYQFGDWPDNGSGGNGQSASNACSTATTISGVSNALAQADCTSCVQTKGYWLNTLVNSNDTSKQAGVFAGNWLLFNPPKYLLMKLVYKMLVDGPLLAPLRQANLSQNGSKGASLNQKYLPSCNGNGRPMNQITNALESLSFSDTAYPMGEMLMNAGYYNSNGSDFFSYFNTHNADWTSNSGPCPGCNQNFVVMIADGRGDTANATCVKNALGVMPAYCTAQAQCSTLGMGAEDDGNDYLDPSWLSAVTGSSVRKTPAGTCDMDFADDVAGWMATHDMAKGTTGTNVLTYVLGIGSNARNELTPAQEVAKAGLGQYVSATNFSEIGQGLVSIFQQIITRATSFSVAAITTVQTRGTTFAFVPRFRPQQGRQWKGSLYRFKLYNEFSAGCQASDYGKITSLNPNGNSSCSDVYLKDADGDFIGENANGDFVKLDNTQAYTAPPSINPWPIRSPETPATPVWEASSVLSSRVQALNNGTSTDQRTVYTVYSQAGGGTYDTTVQFSTANASTIAPLLKLGGVNGAFCSELAARSRHTYSSETDCATDVIKYMLGQDIMYENPLNQTTPPPAVLYPRVNMLGDIFHSSPILVTPPTPQYLCDLGVATQCVYSLYATPLTPNGSAAYTSYQSTYQYRTQVLLVGANDGMLHAFNAGNDKTGDDPETPTVESAGTHYFDLGTGREMWAFIPPDLLPKLKLYILGQRHEMFVDGTPMVRDIWVDGSGSTAADHKKQADEFHTVAVVGEREGGRRYFALDVTDVTNPKFLWMWPLAGTTQDLEAGQSWNDHTPAPPPIGPVAIDDPTGAFAVNGTNAAEKYVVAVGGGFDPNQQRGRGFFLLDAWTGSEVFRFARIDATTTTEPRSRVRGIAATPTLIDTNGDGLFDALVVGDTNGAVWAADFMTPGKDTNNDGRVDNWYAARSYVQFKGLANSNRSPFFQLAAAVQQSTGEVRILLGSGDRSQVRGVGGSTCGIADLRGCIREGCSVDVQTKNLDIGSHYDRGQWTLDSGASTYANNTFSIDGTPTSQTGASCSDIVKVDQEYTITCGGTTSTYSNTLYCDWGASVAGTDCPDTTGRPLYTDADANYTSPALTAARFYSFKLFDTTGNRVRFGSSSTQATTYDTNSLSETNLVDADSTLSSTTGSGWYVTYPGQDDKTASGTLILSGCAVWNTLVPNNTQAISCGTIPADTANLYHADPVTGSTSCGNGLPAALASVRYTTRNAIVPPPMPTPVVAVNSNTGQIQYSGVSLEPGGQPLQISVGQNDLVGTIHWLEVPRQTHDCRHNGTNCDQAAR